MSRRSVAPHHRRVRLTTAVATRLISTVPFFEEELRLLPALVPPGGTCVDVGAAHGIYTVAMAAAVGPTGRVLSFEPQPLPRRVASTLRRALGLHNVVELQRIALGDRTAEDVMVVPYRGRMPVTGRAFVPGGTGNGQIGSGGPGDGGLGGARRWLPPARVADEGFTGSRFIPVQVRPLDALASALRLERLDLVKIDVEGAELRTLAGAEQTLERFRPTLIVEIEARHTARYGHAAEAVFTWLTTRGYRAVAYDGNLLRNIEGIVDGVRNYVFVDDGLSCQGRLRAQPRP